MRRTRPYTNQQQWKLIDTIATIGVGFAIANYFVNSRNNKELDRIGDTLEKVIDRGNQQLVEEIKKMNGGK